MPHRPSPSQFVARGRSLTADSRLSRGGAAAHLNGRADGGLDDAEAAAAAAAPAAMAMLRLVLLSLLPLPQLLLVPLLWGLLH
eukprot:364318-Chlamydomonas_euryale.AAC.7